MVDSSVVPWIIVLFSFHLTCSDLFFVILMQVDFLVEIYDLGVRASLMCLHCFPFFLCESYSSVLVSFVLCCFYLVLPSGVCFTYSHYSLPLLFRYLGLIYSDMQGSFFIIGVCSRRTCNARAFVFSGCVFAEDVAVAGFL